MYASKEKTEANAQIRYIETKDRNVGIAMVINNDLRDIERCHSASTEIIINTAAININGAKISTVFLGIDHQFGMGSPPILFETMVFGGELDQEQERYCTYREAEEGHKRWVAKAKGGD